MMDFPLVAAEVAGALLVHDNAAIGGRTDALLELEGAALGGIELKAALDALTKGVELGGIIEIQSRERRC